MHTRYALIGIALACLSRTSPAHDLITTKITWSREISRLVYRSCTSCHHEGGSAFSLVSWQEARPWAKAIKDEVLNRRMPPWNAVKGFGDLKDDRGLTQEDLELVAQWVEGGAPEGNPLYAPKPPSASAGPEASAAPVRGRKLAISGNTLLKAPLNALGVEAAEVGSGGDLQVIAVRPDGSAEPLIWIREFDPKYRRTYYFRKSLRFAAGTKIEVFPPDARAALLVGPGS
jgi:hypothetical protein